METVIFDETSIQRNSGEDYTLPLPVTVPMTTDGLAQLICNYLPSDGCIYSISVWLLDQTLSTCPAVSLLSILSINQAIANWKDGVKQQDMGQYVSERNVFLKKKSLQEKE